MRHVTSKKTPAADRSHGGPGSSGQDANKPARETESGREPGEPTSGRRSRVSGGGGERDSHHTHYPPGKGKGRL
jgi:hypothetical protein